MMRSALILLTASLTLFSQGRPALRPRQNEPFRHPGGRRLGPVAEQVLNRLHQMHVQRIQQNLGLPEERARGIADRWRTYDMDWMERGQRQNQLRHQFNQVLIGPGSEDEKSARLAPLVDEFFTLRRQQMEIKQKFEEDVRSGLSSSQQVRLVLLVDDLHKELIQGIRDAVQQQ